MKPNEFKSKVKNIESVLDNFVENENATESRYTGEDGFSKIVQDKTGKELRIYHFYISKIFENASEAFVFTDANDNTVTLVNPPEKYKGLCGEILDYFGMDFEMRIDYAW
jgi:hypothetical protein